MLHKTIEELRTNGLGHGAFDLGYGRVSAGDLVEGGISVRRTGQVIEIFPDGDAWVNWDDGISETVKWRFIRRREDNDEPSAWALERANVAFQAAGNEANGRPGVTVRITHHVALALDAGRRDALEKASQIVRGELPHEGYRIWPWYGIGSASNEDPKVAFADAAADAILALTSREPPCTLPPPEDPTPAMIARGQRIAAATGSGLTETQVHDIWQAMMDEWQAAQEPKT